MTDTVAVLKEVNKLILSPYTLLLAAWIGSTVAVLVAFNIISFNLPNPFPPVQSQPEKKRSNSTLQQINDLFSDSYKTAKSQIAAKIGPLLIVNASSNVLTLLCPSSSNSESNDGLIDPVTKRKQFMWKLNTQLYDILKVVSHASAIIPICVDPDTSKNNADGNLSISEDMFKNLQALNKLLEKLMADMENDNGSDGFKSLDIETSHAVMRILVAIQKMLTLMLSQNRTPNGEQTECCQIDKITLNAFGESIQSYVDRCIKMAAENLVDNLLCVMDEVKSVLKAESLSWDDIHVVVCGSHMPQKSNSFLTFFKTIQHDEGVTEGNRTYYCTNQYSPAEALDLVATHILNAHMASVIWNDKERMHKDVLGPATEEVIQTRHLHART
ncbi:hypothetical protein BKA69DRAFT_81928 [Paraphysoderma sedebokerense]|nr:hypothetical protein BKA69DRAFT_80180 [Paraphysoderma sedebokerense]KAI9143567.1 hypothetical protein BKA69DRAFT_81928 [Paraphysoderma sedebokerense]